MSGGKQVPWACNCLFSEQLWPSCRKMERTVKEGASEDSSSAIRQAYLAALQQELASLYQLMAQLDALAGHPLPTGGPITGLHARCILLQQTVSAPIACKHFVNSCPSWTLSLATHYPQVGSHRYGESPQVV